MLLLKKPDMGEQKSYYNEEKIFHGSFLITNSHIENKTNRSLSNPYNWVNLID
jgi:hypothetical protein